ncbi:hypothetical protein BS47DRAFT_1422053 [Hydnum rufescens UP504]|uniref:Peptidase A1 domain-containing protein n=1 Tax=Hydnum rufescens UP504 TaxID=1448309 RepID=A0A9P6AKD4_9AGAM|nr:hypothetical protein BS47DRAFT_1422053 [Hydnum rufescens UP504]
MEHELQLRERTVGAPAAPGVAPGVAPSVAPSAAPSGGALLTAEDVQNDLEYVVPVTIGTPPQVVNLDFDTGSADLWRTSAANLKGHGIYNPGRSSTAKLAPGLNWKISYGDGSGASGSVYKDVVKFSNLAIPGQAVEVATQLSSTFLGEHSSDGLLGLAFPTINTITPTKQKTPVQELVERNIIKQPIFTAKLDKGGTGTHTAASSRIIYTDVDSSHGFWEFGSPQLRVGRKTVNRRPACRTNDAALDAIYRPIPGARIDHSGWIVPTKSRPPDISFSVAGVFFAIAGEDLKFADAGGGMSFGSIQSRGQNRQDILGDVFLKRVLTVFDQTPGHPRIGFGQRAFT